MSIESDLRRGGGCLLRRDLVRSDADARLLNRLIGTGAVERVGRGVYALPGAGPGAIAARLAGGLLTCVSSAVDLGLPLVTRPHAPHVVVPRSRTAPRSGHLPRGTTVHWDRLLDGDGREHALSATPASLRSTPRLFVPPALALVHALRCLPSRDVVALWDGAVNRSLVDLAELRSLRPARAGRCRFDAVLRAVDGRSQSLPETFLRLGLRTAGLSVEPQVLVEGVGFVDFLVERLLIVEVDGFAFHGDRRAFAEDRRRDRDAHAVGLSTVRFTYAESVHGTASAAGQVVETVRGLRALGVRRVDPRFVAPSPSRS